MRSDYYVYLHRDLAGNIFYVGKGSGQRAWSLNRHLAWTKYVAERLAGDFRVEVLRQGMTEADAEALEGKLIVEYGGQLINWVNPGRDFDFAALGRYHQLRDENRRFVEETRPFESLRLEHAVTRYREALETMRVYEAMTLERGLVAEMKVGPDWGDPNILNRLTICLVKLGRNEEAITAVGKYFNEFPSAGRLSLGKQILKRIEKLRAKMAPT